MSDNYFYILGQRAAQSGWKNAHDYMLSEHGEWAAEQYQMGRNSVLFGPEMVTEAILKAIDARPKPVPEV